MSAARGQPAELSSSPVSASSRIGLEERISFSTSLSRHHCLECIEGHESLRRIAGLHHRDISLNNLMIDKDNRGFLIDLDLAIKEQRVGIAL